MTTELDKSYELIGRILERLIDSGLRKVSLAPGDFELPEAEGPYFLDVVGFLSSEGLIRVGRPQYDCSINEVQLTSKGIAAVEDRRFDAGKSIRQTLDDAKGEVSGETYGKAGSFFGGLLGGFTTSIAG